MSASAQTPFDYASSAGAADPIRRYDETNLPEEAKGGRGIEKSLETKAPKLRSFLGCQASSGMRETGAGGGLSV
jgi:hypothetical protein